jgi:hypothetical protein
MTNLPGMGLKICRTICLSDMERAFEFLMAVAWWAVVISFFMDAMK